MCLRKCLAELRESTIPTRYVASFSIWGFRNSRLHLHVHEGVVGRSVPTSRAWGGEEKARPSVAEEALHCYICTCILNLVVGWIHCFLIHPLLCAQRTRLFFTCAYARAFLPPFLLRCAWRRLVECLGAVVSFPFLCPLPHLSL